MSDTVLAQAAGPRRYRVSFNCRADAVGAVIGLLIKEVENPKMETIADSFKLTLVCFHDQLRTVVDMVLDDADNLVIAPFVPEVKPGPVVFRPQVAASVRTPMQRDVTYLPAQRRVRGESKGADSPMGKIAMKIFADGGRVKHPADFHEALIEAGYAPTSTGYILKLLSEEGSIVKIGHGAYRLPTTQDQLRAMEQRDPSFSADKAE